MLYREKYELSCDEIEGYTIKNITNNREYALLEGKSLNGSASSDIIFIFEVDTTGYETLVDYVFGAGFFEDEDQEELNFVLDDIESYEEKLLKKQFTN